MRDEESESHFFLKINMVDHGLTSHLLCRILETRLSSPGDTRPMAGDWASREVPPGHGWGLRQRGIAGVDAISAQQPGKSIDGPTGSDPGTVMHTVSP